jgi:hypothetical protein
LGFVYRDGKELDVGGHAAYQAIAVSEGKAVLIAAFVLQTSWVTIASVMYPLKETGDPLAQISWKCYNKFVESVKEIH